MIMAKFRKWLWTFIKPLSRTERREITEQLEESTIPGFDYFLLVVLSCSIATLGLITNSMAVIIGAMLLAPLMSPIIAIGLASIIGNPILLRNSVSALFRGALLAIALAFLVTLVNNQLPFISMQEIPAEIISRSRATPIDLAIALAGGLAAAYALTQPNLSAALPGVAIATALMPPLCTIGIGVALGRWDIAGGASLLFLTNAITIAFASVFVFFLRGFGSSTSDTEHRLPRSLLLTAIMTIVLLIPLSIYSIKFFNDASQNRMIQEVIHNEIDRLENSELVELNINRNGETLEITMTIRTNAKLTYQQVVELQKEIVRQIKQPVSIQVNQVFAENLDPLKPPTPTFTPTISNTPTPGPSPTFTQTFTPTASATQTPENTATSAPTHTATSTATPAVGQVVRGTLPDMLIYQAPGGPSIGYLSLRQKVTVYDRQLTYNGLVWVQIMDGDGRVGWIPEMYINQIYPTLTAIPATYTATMTATETEIPDMALTATIMATRTATAGY